MDTTTTPCCNPWALLHPNGPAIALRAPDRDSVRQKKKHDRVTLTGHSLGGTLALHSARHHGARAIVFNPGSSPLAEPFHAAVCSTIDCGYSKRQRIYSTGRDPISLSSYLFDRLTDDVITVPSKERSDLLSHSLIHFLPRRMGVSTAPLYLDPVTIGTGERVPFCQAFPELCPLSRG